MESPTENKSIKGLEGLYALVNSSFRKLKDYY